jgi:branched-subunit amino acid transport protein
VSAAWTAVIVVGAGTVALKAAGPVLLGGRPLPPRAGELLSMLAPALLAALVVTQAFADGRHLVLDARAAGLGAAAVAIALRSPLLAVVVVAAVATALVRLLQ